MDVKGNIAEKVLKTLISLDFISEFEIVDTISLVEKYVETAFEVEKPVQNLVTVQVEGSVPFRVIKFDPIAAAGLLASIVSGTLGVGNGILLSMAVITSVASIFDLYEKASTAEGAIFWIVYNFKGNRGARSEVKEEFDKMCLSVTGLDSEDFSSALQGLFDMGILDQDGDELFVSEQLVYVSIRQ